LDLSRLTAARTYLFTTPPSREKGLNPSKRVTRLNLRLPKAPKVFRPAI